MNYVKSKCADGAAFTSFDDDEENYAHMLYLQKNLQGLKNTVVDDMSTVKLKYGLGEQGCKPEWVVWQNSMPCLVNSYPKEWLVHEIESDPLLGHDLADVESFEPFWKLIMSSKALLPLLWSMYPNHPNLLPAYYDNPEIVLGKSMFLKHFGKEHWVSKPLFGREG